MKPIVILLVEDDPDDVELTRNALKQLGINEEVVVARDGAEAFEYFDDNATPALSGTDRTETIVLLDVNLPETDGFEVCRRLRDSETDRPPYVIMLTVKEDKQDVVRGLEAGADDYLPKPFDPDELGARIGVGRRILALQDRMAEKVHELQEALDDIRALGQAASSLSPFDAFEAD